MRRAGNMKPKGHGRRHALTVVSSKVPSEEGIFFIALDERDDSDVLSSIKQIAEDTTSKTAMRGETREASFALPGLDWDLFATSVLKVFERERELNSLLGKLVDQGGGAVVVNGRRFSLKPDEAGVPGEQREDVDALRPISAEESEALMAPLLERGLREQKEILERPEMLSLEEASKLTGLVTRTITDRRNKGRLLALSMTGAQKGFRFPAWQFEPRVLEAMPAIIAAFGQDRQWQAYDFLTLPEPTLGRRIPLEMLRDGLRDAVERVLPCVTSLSQGST